jgi:transposase
MAEPKRKFTPEFKLEAVRLAAAGNKPLAQVARELGILPNLLRNWRRQVEDREGQPPAGVFPGHGQLPSQDEELRRLRREVESLRQERDFLKKTAAYFAKESR